MFDEVRNKINKNFLRKEQELKKAARWRKKERKKIICWRREEINNTRKKKETWIIETPYEVKKIKKKVKETWEINE